MEEPSVVVMAAGLGSRYGGYKQIDSIVDSGEIILDFSLYDAMMAGFKKAVLVIRDDIEDALRAHMKEHAERFMEVEYVKQELSDIPAGFSVPAGREKPWGTAHAAMTARHAVDGPFVVINADDYYGAEGFGIIYDYLTRGKKENGVYDFCMVSYLLRNTVTENGSVARGVCEIDADGYLNGITERTRIECRDGGICFTEDDGKTWTGLDSDIPVSMNFWGFERGFMDELERFFTDFLKKDLAADPLKSEYMLPLQVGKLIDDGRAKVKVLRSHDSWIGVTYKADKEDAGRKLQAMKDKGLYPEVI